MQTHGVIAHMKVETCTSWMVGMHTHGVIAHMKVV
jgi:hypothetical protein